MPQTSGDGTVRQPHGQVLHGLKQPSSMAPSLAHTSSGLESSWDLLCWIWRASNRDDFPTVRALTPEALQELRPGSQSNVHGEGESIPHSLDSVARKVGHHGPNKMVSLRVKESASRTLMAKRISTASSLTRGQKHAQLKLFCCMLRLFSSNLITSMDATCAMSK